VNWIFKIRNTNFKARWDKVLEENPGDVEKAKAEIIS
jgi:hypothetical protein